MTYDPSLLINYIYETMTEQEKIKFKSLNILKSGVMNSKHKNCNKKNYSICFPITNISLNLDRSFSNASLPDLSIKKQMKESLVLHAIKEIEVQFLATKNRKTALSASSNIVETKLKLNNYNLPIKSKRIISKVTKI